METTTKRRGRGLASMDAETRSRIASMGGKKAHANGTAHRWTKEEAQAAGRIGGSRGHKGKGPQGKRARAALNAYFMSTEEE